MNAQVQIRFPLIPGITDTEQNLDSLRTFMNERTALSAIDILPYHRSGHSKYQRLGRTNQVQDVVPPDQPAVDRVQKYFANGKRVVRIGG